jgi:hypothetical protein
MESLDQSRTEYSNFRKIKLIPKIESLIKEAMELGYNVSFKVSDDGKLFKPESERKSVTYKYSISKDGINIKVMDDSNIKTDYDYSNVELKEFAQLIASNEFLLNKFYDALLEAQKNRPKLKGKYIDQ